MLQKHIEPITTDSGADMSFPASSDRFNTHPQSCQLIHFQPLDARAGGHEIVRLSHEVEASH